MKLKGPEKSVPFELSPAEGSYVDNAKFILSHRNDFVDSVNIGLVTVQLKAFVKKLRSLKVSLDTEVGGADGLTVQRLVEGLSLLEEKQAVEGNKDSERSDRSFIISAVRSARIAFAKVSKHLKGDK